MPRTSANDCLQDGGYSSCERKQDVGIFIQTQPAIAVIVSLRMVEH